MDFIANHIVDVTVYLILPHYTNVFTKFLNLIYKKKIQYNIRNLDLLFKLDNFHLH